MILSTSFLALLAVVPVLGSPSPAGAHVAFHRPKSAVATPDGSAVITQNLRDTIGQILQKNAVPGSAIALVRLGDDGGAEYGAWGNRTEDGDPVTTDTLFGIASTSKAFFTTSLGILIDDFANGRNKTALPDGLNEFNWDTKLTALLPGQWALMDKWASKNAALKDALSHVTGLPRHDFSYSRNSTIDDVFEILPHLRPTFEFRERWNYINVLYVALTEIFHKYAKTTYPNFVAERIFTPLNMSSSSFSPSQANSTGRFTQSWSAGGTRRIPTWFGDYESQVFSGPGGIVSSVEDMAKWVALQLGGSEAIAKAAYEAPHQARAVGAGPFRTYGMGWAQDTVLGHPIVWHTGGIPGVSSLVTLFPKDSFGIVQLTNADNKDFVNIQVMGLLANATLGGKFEDNGLLSLLQTLGTPAEDKATQHARRAELQNLPSLEALAGTYNDPAYGDLSFCAPSSTSEECAPVLAAYTTVRPNATESDSLFASWPRVWGDHLELARGPDGSFEWIPSSLFPNGFGKDESPFQLPAHDGSHAMFDIDEQGKVKGFGLLGIEGLVSARSKSGKTVQEKADVWFRRVD